MDRFAAETTVKFSTAHITFTAVLVGVLAIPLAYWLLRPPSPMTIATICTLAALATFGERLCANMTQLNDDGVPMFSANDLLAPALTYIVLSIYADLRPPENPQSFARLRVAVTALALVVNVVTI